MFTFFRQALSLLSAKQRQGVYFILVTSALAAAVQTAAILSMMPFIVLLTNPSLHESNDLLVRAYEMLGADSYQEFLGIFGLIAIVVLTAGNVFVAFEQWLSVRFLNLLSHDIRRRLLRKILQKPYEDITATHSAVLGDTVLNQVSRVVDGVIGTYISIFSSVALASLIVIVLLVISLKTTLLTLLGLLVAYVAVFLMLRRRVEADGEESTHLSAAVFATVSETLDGIREIRTRRAESYFVRRFEATDLQMSKLQIHHSMMDFLPHYVLETAVFAGFVGVALYFLFTTADAGVSMSYIALYGIAVYRMVPAMKGIFEGMSTVHHNGDAVRAVSQYFDEPEPVGELREVAAPKESIKLEQVSFRYASAEQPQLDAIDVTIPAGSSVCLFGPSGCGKTTILNMVAGLLSPQEGRVSCDGVAIAADTIDSWRKKIGYAPQQAYLFADTLASNIAFGLDAEAIDQERVIEAGRKANLQEFVSRLPGGYQTVIAEQGESLSGGQRQRVGIARALYYDPAVLILDESFANLDAGNRTDILDRLFGLEGRTLVFSSHETAVASRCDKVIVIERGKVVAEGRYQDLLRDSPRFVELLSLMNRESESDVN